MRTATKAPVDIALRDAWLNTLDALEAQISAWVSAEPGWTVTQGETDRFWKTPWVNTQPPC